MPKQNPYLIKNVEKLPKTEQIVYLDQNYQPQSFEEFMKTYEPNEEVEIITEAEYQDRLLHGPRFGPGNEQSKANVAKWGGKIAVATTASLLFPPAGVVIGGAAAWGVCKYGENTAQSEDAKEIWKFLGDMGSSSAVGGLVDWSALKAANKTADELKHLYNALSQSKDKVMLKIHIDHLSCGVNYLSGCEVCEA